MKTKLIAGLALFAVAFAVFGCPTTNNGTQTDTKLSKSDAATLVRDQLRELGYTTEVSVYDIDENGAADFDISYVSGNEDNTIIIFLAHITGVLGVVHDYTDFQSDKAVVRLGDEVYAAFISDLNHCVQLLDTGTDADVENCLYDSWIIIQSSDDEPAPDEGDDTSGFKKGAPL